MELKEIIKSFREDADCLEEDWRSMSKTQIANKYCDYDESGDTETRDHWFSALMSKYTYMITFFYKRRTGLTARLTIEDFYVWVNEALLKGLKYRRWRDSEYSSLYNNPNGAEIVFNRCFYSIEKFYFIRFNRPQRKINYMSYSLDGVYNASLDDDKSVSSIELLYNEGDIPSVDANEDVVLYYTKKNRIIDAIFVDNISNNSVFTERDTLNKNNLLKCIESIDDNYIDYFTKHYNVSKTLVEKSASNIRSNCRSTLRMRLNHLLNEMKEDSNVLTILGVSK